MRLLDTVEMLDVYGHLWPGSEADTVTAVDRALAPVLERASGAASRKGTRTAPS